MSIMLVPEHGGSASYTPETKKKLDKAITQLATSYANTTPTYRAPTTTRSSSSSSSGSSGGSTGDGGAAAAAARAAAAAAAAQKEAEEKAIRQANEAGRSQATQNIDRLNTQITAALSKRAVNAAALSALEGLVGGGSGSHASVRDAHLRTIDQALSAKLAQLRETFNVSFADFQTNLRDNEATEADSTFANYANRAREKGDLVTQALSQGAGESDVLNSQMQALRNWAANQGDINRSFFDTRSSINSGITDLNQATKTGMLNEELSANTLRGQKWDDYYSAMSNTLSDMATLDQNQYLLSGEISAAEREKTHATGVLDWLESGKNMEDYTTPKLASIEPLAAEDYTSEYARRSAEAAGASWESPGVSAETTNWRGGRQSEGGLNTARMWNSQDNNPLDGRRRRKAPEGAPLRRW